MRGRIIDEIESAIFLEPKHFDEAIIGVAHRFGMDPVVANTIGAWMGDLTPVFIDTRPAE